MSAENMLPNRSEEEEAVVVYHGSPKVTFTAILDLTYSKGM
jgi:hypothetical protein